LLIQGQTIKLRTTVDQLNVIIEKYSLTPENVVELTGSQFLLPGFIDTHIHAPQFPNIGIGLDLPLLEWLQKYTFPMEAKFEDSEFARKVYTKCVRTTLGYGTTTACYFGSIHREASEVLVQICNQLGQRAFVGKVCMDRNSPDFYVEQTDESLEETVKFVDQVEKTGGHLVKPIITPRFAPSCTRKLMKSLGELAISRQVHVQTHISEHPNEVDWVLSLEPDCKSYTQVYEKCDLLGPRTILAHGIYLDEEEMETLRTTGSGVSHCPNSNIHLQSGFCQVRNLIEAGVKVGLGTDCSGGYSPSMLNAMRYTVVNDNVNSITNKSSKPISCLNFADALHLATRGGAELLDMADRLGSLDEGKLADLVLADMTGQNDTDLFGFETPEDMVQKFVMLADDRNIVEVIVAGKTVKGHRK